MKMKKNIDNKNFWDIRSEHYDKLFWTKDDNYIEAIIKFCKLKKSHFILDVGTGTGAIAKAIKPYVKHVVAIDTSDSMLQHGEWNNISVIKWDINNTLFNNGLFDKVVARMVFHHVIDNLDRALLRCYDILKDGGEIIIAEGIPPSDDNRIVSWYSEMFKHKEKRRTFNSSDIQIYLQKNGFKEIKAIIHVMENFNINNWLENSGLSKNKQKVIYNMHINADKYIKQSYNMRIINNECFVDTKNIIVSGKKIESYS